MPMSYTQKNPFLKNGRYTPTQSTLLLRLFLRGYQAGNTATALSIPKPTVTRFFEHVRSRIFSDERFTASFIRALLFVNFDGAAYLLKRVAAIQPGQISDCAYHCSRSAPPKVVRLTIQSRPDQRAQIDALKEFATQRKTCTYCPLRLYEYVSPEHSKPEMPHDPTVISTLYSNLRKAPRSVDPADYKFFMETFGDAIRVDAEPVGYTYLIEYLRMKPDEDTDAMNCWVRALCHMGAYRRVTKDNIVQFVIMALVFRAIQCRDIGLPPEIHIPHAVQVAPGLGDMTAGVSGHVQNDIEGFILASALKVLQENPF